MVRWQSLTRKPLDFKLTHYRRCAGSSSTSRARDAPQPDPRSAMMARPRGFAPYATVKQASAGPRPVEPQLEEHA